MLAGLTVHDRVIINPRVIEAGVAVRIRGSTREAHRASHCQSPIMLKTIRFELRLALRHLRFGGGQTLLTVSAVAVGVSIVIFITALIFGFRQKLTILSKLCRSTFMQIKAVQPMLLADLPGAAAGRQFQPYRTAGSTTEVHRHRLQVADTVRRLTQVRLVAPAVRGRGFASREWHRVGVVVVGIDPALRKT